MFASVVFEALAKLCVAGVGAIYIGLVLMSYRLDGSNYQLRFDWRDPVRALERICVWSGVRTLAKMVSLGRYIFSLLSEISADVGEEYVRRRPRSALAAFRSRFL